MLKIWDAKHSLDEYIARCRVDESGAIRPVVAAASRWRGAGAHRYIHARENIGKVVLEP